MGWITQGPGCDGVLCGIFPTGWYLALARIKVAAGSQYEGIDEYKRDPSSYGMWCMY
jgi:hypothetical protein